MLVPGKPANEAVCIQALHDLKLLDTAPQERFDRLTRLAKRLFNVPIARVTLVDKDRQWFKSPLLFGKQLPDILECLELQRIAARVKQKHRRLFAHQPLKTDPRLDHESSAQ